MSFVTVNGITIPVDSATESFTSVYADTRAFNGQARKAHVAVKRTWNIKSTPLYIEDCHSLAGLIAAKHDAWTFDDLTLFSDKGVNGSAGHTIPAFVANSSAADQAFNPESPTFSPYAVYTGVGNSNLISPTPDATMEGDPPCTIQSSHPGGSLTMDTSHKWQGTQSMHYNGPSNPPFPFPPLPPSGFFSNTYSATPGAALTVSFMVYNGQGVAAGLTFSLNTPGGSAFATANITVPAGGWYRFALTGVVPGGGTWNWQILELVSQANSLWFDGVQAEYSAFATPWITPGGMNISSPTGTLYMAPDTTSDAVAAFTDLPAGGFSVAMWLTWPPFDAQRFIWASRFGSGGFVGVYTVYSAGHQLIIPFAYNEQGAYSAAGGYTIPQDYQVDSWHHLVVSLRDSPNVGSSWIDMYIDGVLQSVVTSNVATAAAMPRASALTVITTDLASGSSPYNFINEVRIHPFPLSANVVAKMYANPNVPTIPNLYLSGAITGGQTVTAVARSVSVEPMTMQGKLGPGPGLKTCGILSFVLEEL